MFHPDAATDGLKKQKLLLMLQECNEQEAAEILPAIEYLLSPIHIKEAIQTSKGTS
jgi:hypothetical protein